MKDAQPRMSWWRKKRWWVALLLWIILAYPSSLWPIAYGVGRGWLPVAAVKAAYYPLLAAADSLRPHPGIGLAPPDVDGRRRYIVLPDPDPWPSTIANIAERYIDSIEWFANLGQKHAD